MSLPESWIDRIFERLSCLYGSKFADMWRGTDVHQLKTVWADKLGGFCDRPEIIRLSLESLDEKPWPPTLPEFLEICRNHARRVGSETKRIEPPQLSIEERMERAEVLAAASAKQNSYDYRGWAKYLRREYLEGVHLLPIQILMASEALNETWENGQCKPRS
jgi:hypothetical protein